MKRAIALGVALTFVTGCSGGGINGGNLLPGMSPNVRAPGGGLTTDGRHRVLDVHVTMRIPKRHRRDHADLHPATISPLTRSVGFVINGGAAQIFNATTSSSNCKATTSGTLCTFSVKAPPGSDSFIVTTYSSTGGAGTALDRAVAKITITAGKANAPTIRLGPVVSVATDSGAGSLRYAIATANSGDTILFTIPSTSKITLASSLTLNANVTIAGPGTTTTARPHSDSRHPDLTSAVSVSGLQISGAGTQQIFVVNGGVNATISGLVLTDGLATTTNQPGGAIYNAGSLTLHNDGFTDNGSQVSTSYIRVHPHARRHRDRHPEQPHRLRPHACTIGTQYGGAIYNHGNIVVSGSTFASNVLQNCFNSVYSYGGAIYTDEYSTLTSSGNIYSANAAYYGGAVYVNTTYGEASFTSDQFIANTGCGTSTGCPSSGCSTLTAKCTTSYPEGYGGAIYDGEGPGITVTSSTFTSNLAGGTSASSFGEGGAINLETGSPVITGSTFTGNKAGGGTANCSYGEGGAIYEDVGNAIELDNDTFTGNIAGGDDDSYGGAVYNDSDPDNGSGNKFTSNQAYATGSACETYGEAAGGALEADYGITMSNSSFTSNVAKGSGEAYGGAIDTDTSGSVLLSKDTFTSNSAVGTGLHGASDAEAYGGAIYTDLSTRLTGDTFSTNGAVAQTAIGDYAYGGAIYSDGTLISNGNTFTSNSATISSATASTIVYGGAVYTDSSYYSNGDKFSSNKATGRTSANGGALYADYSTFGITNGTFSSNTVTASAGKAFGGALSLSTHSSGTLSGGSFSANKSTSTGYTNVYDHGGGAIDAETSVTISGITATGNSVVGGAGGGIYGDGDVVTINNSTVSGNSASGAGDYGGGGGIFNDYVMSITNTTVSGNAAAVNGADAGGGGIYVDDTFTMSGSTVSGNKVTGTGTHSGGGGIFSYDSGTYTNDTISGNSSSIDGGGFDEYGAYAAFLDNVTMYQNKATGKGGNIYNDNNTSPYVTLANTIVAGGTAGAAGGADVYNSGTMTSMGYNILQTAQVGGGTFTPATGDKTANPNLLALSNNGGPTFTNADQSTSPGKAYIPWTSASNGTCGTVTDMGFDQRGYTRGGGNKCDVGAYELSGSPYAIKVRPHAKLRPDPRKPRPHPHARHIPPHERGKS
ncbi:MAG TPA: choice-of-anchor Q domain-containing protein [Candidatus Baltobacteraceae bacterium]|jgi:hypothetical protein